MSKLSRVLFAALVAGVMSASAEVLVYEGFDAGDYKLGATDCSTVSDGDLLEVADRFAIGTGRRALEEVRAAVATSAQDGQA